MDTEYTQPSLNDEFRFREEPGWYHPRPFIQINDADMELNPVRQRIADLRGRLDSLRGYL